MWSGQPVARGTTWTFFGIGLIGFAGALAAWWALVRLDPGGDGALLVASIRGFPMEFICAAACGLAIGLAAATGVTARSRVARAALATAVVATLCLALIGAYVLWTERGFDAASFREAARTGDLEALESQAYRIERDGDLIGMTTARARGLLGPPERVRRDERVWVWELGIVNDAIGPGDAGSFRVAFDRRGRVAFATVDP